MGERDNKPSHDDPDTSPWPVLALGVLLALVCLILIAGFARAVIAGGTSPPVGSIAGWVKRSADLRHDESVTRRWVVPRCRYRSVGCVKRSADTTRAGLATVAGGDGAPPPPARAGWSGPKNKKS